MREIKSSMILRSLVCAAGKMELPFIEILTTIKNDVYISRFVFSVHR